ncbi:MAG: hypothetical protein LBH84_05995 [Prevotellaceae bacterium]|jgi:hypothetical protein|nr:hypothetical protein [Prevotellaceae bacterium]
MGTLTYLFESGVCAAALWVAYYCLLRRGTSFTVNRFFLLLAMPTSAIIPLLRLPLLPAVAPAAAVRAVTAVPVATFSAEAAAEAGVAAGATAGAGLPVALLLTLYVVGATCCAACAARRLYSACRLASAGYPADAESGYAFTFFRKIYVNRNAVSAADYEKIMLHEQAHARQLHSLDLALAELFAALQWFNPLAWQFKKSLVEVHEYIADACAIAHGADAAGYMHLLYCQTVGVHPEYVSGFNHSLTKKRLSMMTKNKRSKLPALRLLAVAPVVALLVAQFGCARKQDAAMQNEKEAVVLSSADFLNMFSGDTVVVSLKRGGKMLTMTLTGSKNPVEMLLKEAGFVMDSIDLIRLLDEPVPLKSDGVVHSSSDTLLEESNMPDKKVIITMKTGDVVEFFADSETPLKETCKKVVITRKSGEVLTIIGKNVTSMVETLRKANLNEDEIHSIEVFKDNGAASDSK